MPKRVETRKRNDCRSVHIDGDLWQYKWGKSFVVIYSPENKRHNVPAETVYIVSLGKEEYERRLKDSREWSYYKWDKVVVPSDFDLEPLELCSIADMVRTYIEKTLK